MSSNDKNKDIALKAWDIYQGLAKGMGESAWKIRSVCFATSAALIAYTYNSSSPALYLLVSALAVLFMMLESGYRRLQDQYIEKSNLIELTLNDFIANEERPRFPDSIGTDVNTPSPTHLLKLFKPKRVVFWLPYLLLFVVPILLWKFEITKAI
jgi:hypothetical protein